MIKNFIRSIFLFSAPVLLASCAEEKAQPRPQPNVIMIVAGDLLPSDLGPYSGGIPTPNLDRLASIGTVFDRAYAAASQVGPARAALASGRYPQRFGYQYDTGNVRKTITARTGMPDNVLLVQERLQSYGYTTALYGSWHLGAAPDFYPMYRGYDSFWGTLGAYTAYTDTRRQDAEFAQTQKYRLPPSRSRFNTIFAGQRATTVSNMKQYLTDDMGDQIVKFLDEKMARQAENSIQTSAMNIEPPFFVWASFHAPREPLTALKADLVGLEAFGNKNRQIYAAMVRALDRNVGKVLDAVERAGRLEDTLIVFTSDRGCDSAAQTCPCGTLRAGAPTFREGGLRVPLIVSMPGRLAKNQRVKDPVISMDLTATIVEMTNPRPRVIPEFDGEDLTPLLTGSRQTLGQRTLFWEQFPLSAAVSGTNKILMDGESNRPKLYDLERDPSEQIDLASGDIYTASELETQLDVWRQSNAYPLWDGGKSIPVTICGTEEHILQ